MNCGIHDMALQMPSLYLPIEKLAVARDIVPAKLEKGLGLINMSVCDTDEDVVTLGASAVIQLLKQNPELHPSDIGRIYVGTESSIDGSKPIATYIHQLVGAYLNQENKDVSQWNSIDTLDMTFACIGGIDAMQNSLDWLKSNPSKVAIVVATDIANYDLNSSGEYTQGAGAVAILLKQNPAMLVINERWGVSSQSEHDFFKPIRYALIDGEIIQIHDEKPVFDGQFSNETYYRRMVEAMENAGLRDQVLDAKHLIFHLPYAYHGRRIIADVVIEQLEKENKLSAILDAEGIERNDENFKRLFSKSTWFQNWLSHCIAPGEQLSSHMGNWYTGSIFLSLMSAVLNTSFKSGDALMFIAYGSGSKAKVFSAAIADELHYKIKKWNVNEQLDNRQQITFDEYVEIRTANGSPVGKTNKDVIQVSSGILPTNRFARTYQLNLSN